MFISINKNNKKINIERLRHGIKIFALVLIILTATNYAISPWIDFGINSSQSVDGMLFLVLKKEKPIKGQLMAFWPPKNRFYRHMWFVKYVKGAEGDVVKKVGNEFYINNEFIGEAKEKSQDGRLLSPSHEGRIPKGFYFVWTPHKDSYDSRYQDIGWIPSSRIIGRVVRLF